MPAKRFGSQIDLSKIPVLGLVPESASSAPATPVAGQLWLDTSLTPSRLKVYENGTWVLASQTGTEQTVNKGAVNGYASLDSGTKVPIAQLPTGTTSSTVAIGNDTRLSDARTPTDNSVTGGPAGAGVKIQTGTITDVNVAAANKDGSAAVPSLRTIGLLAAQAMAGNTRLDTIAAPTGALSLNGQLISNVGTPLSGNDAVTKTYADNLRAGLRLKDSVLVATTGPITLTGTQTIDGVALVAGNRVLVKDQASAATNGIYVVAAGAWTRDTDADSFQELQDGSVTFVAQGTLNANQTWAQTATLTALTDPQTWTIQGAATAYLAGLGLSLAGTTFNVGGTANRITVAGSTVDISTAYAGQGSIVTVGALAAGSLAAGFTPVGIAQGGTGATTQAAARTALAAPGYVQAPMAALAAGVETLFTHSLGNQFVHAQFFDATTNYEVMLSWRQYSTSQIGVTADVAYAASAIRAVVVG